MDKDKDIHNEIDEQIEGIVYDDNDTDAETELTRKTRSRIKSLIIRPKKTVSLQTGANLTKKRPLMKVQHSKKQTRKRTYPRRNRMHLKMGLTRKAPNPQHKLKLEHLRALWASLSIKGCAHCTKR